MRHLPVALAWVGAPLLLLALLMALLLPPGQAPGYLFLLLPPALWTLRLIVARRSGRISRRMPMLDGGPAMAGLFFAFRPEIYVRQGGFDNFTGYWIKECACCLLLWLLCLGPILMALGEAVSGTR